MFQGKLKVSFLVFPIENRRFLDICTTVIVYINLYIVDFGKVPIYSLSLYCNELTLIIS